jgi:hypothetical protein
MTRPAARKQALDALLSLSRTALVEGRACSGFHWLGDSPHDAAYRVKLMLTVRFDSASKSYRIGLSISEERYEGGFASQRHEYDMPHAFLGQIDATRFSAVRVQQIYEQTLAELRKDPEPLVSLLQEEIDRA